MIIITSDKSTTIIVLVGRGHLSSLFFIFVIHITGISVTTGSYTTVVYYQGYEKNYSYNISGLNI